MKKILCFFSLLLSSFLFSQTTPDVIKSSTNPSLAGVTLNISATGSGSGQVNVNGTLHPLPYSETFPLRTSVSVKAVPNSWSKFVLWTGSYASESTDLNFIISSNIDISAIFNANLYTLNVNQEGSGTGLISVDGNEYAASYSGTVAGGTYVSLEAKPDEGSVFTSWSGDLKNNTNPTSVFIDGDKSITAIFSIAQYTLAINNAGNGSGSLLVNGKEYALPFSGKFNYGSRVNIEGIANTGSIFNNWSGSLSTDKNPVTVSIDGDKTIDANFSLLQYTLTISKSGTGNGIIKVNKSLQAFPYSNKFDYGTIVNIEAAPDSISTFNTWEGDLKTCYNPTTVTITSDKNISANFSPLPKYALSLSKSGDGDGKIEVNGVVQTLPYFNEYYSGTVVNIKAVPSGISVFNTWEGNLKVNTNPISITMDSSKSISANFSLLPTYTIQINSTGNGSGAVKVDGRICTLPFSAAYYSGQQLSLEAVPDTGSTFNGWTGSLQENTNPVTVTLNENTVISASFILLQYKLNLTGSGNGQVKVNGTIQTLPYSSNFDYGTQVNIEAIPDEGNSFAAWSGDLTGTAKQILVVMDKDKTINAGFKLAIPTKIELLNPSNGLAGVPVIATLRCKMEFDTTNALTYSFEIAKDEAFDSLFNNGTTINNSSADHILSINLAGFDYKTKYYWRVIAVESNGNKVYSDTWSFTTQCKPVAAPTGLTASAVRSDAVLNWIDNSDNELYFAIFRKDGDTLSTNGFQPIDTVQAGKTSYTDTNLQPGAIYTYKICGFNPDTVSCFSNQAAVTTLTAVAENFAPKEFKVLPNYPNPFNPVTVISYQLPATSQVQLKIYNMLGQEISALVNETKGPGYYRCEWDASGYTSGFYIYRIIVQQNDGKQFIKTQKMMLVK